MATSAGVRPRPARAPGGGVRARMTRPRPVERPRHAPGGRWWGDIAPTPPPIGGALPDKGPGRAPPHQPTGQNSRYMRWTSCSGCTGSSVHGIVPESGMTYDHTQTSLIGVAEGAELYGISPNRFRNIMRRPEAPEPLYDYGYVTVWDRSTVVEFDAVRKRPVGRPPRPREG